LHCSMPTQMKTEATERWFDAPSCGGGPNIVRQKPVVILITSGPDRLSSRVSQLLSVAQPKGVGRARASVSEPLRAYAIGKIATGKLRAGPAHGIPVAILPGPEACGLETAGLLLISSCLINRLALEACASLATRNACSGVLGRLRPNPGRRQASVTPAPRLRSWLAS